MMFSQHFDFAQLWCVIFVLQRKCRICKADGSAQTPPGAMLPQPFRYRRSFMYAAVTDISYKVESVASMLVCLLCNSDGKRKKRVR